MPYRFNPSVVMASEPDTRRIVFLTEGDKWTPELARAELIEDEAHGDLRMIEAEYAGRGVRDIRLAEVLAGRTGPLALRAQPQVA